MAAGTRPHLLKPLLQRNVFFLIAIALLGAACSQDDGKTTLSSGLETHTQASIEPARGDRLVSASIGDASNLIPMIASDASSHAIAGQMYLSLLKYDKDLNLTGQLAESWQVAKDNLSIRFKLRQGLKWTDGKPLTSADCAFTLKLLLDEHTQSAYKSDYVKVIRVETADALSFTVYYDEPYSPALSSWTGLAILPEHVFKGVDIMNTELSRKPAATIGPYILGEWQAQQSILLSANKDYFDGPVWISERMTRIIPDSATQFLELSAGNLDSMGLTPTQYSRLFEQKEQLKRNYERYKYLDFGYTYLGFNLKRAPFDDARVRRAIAYAIDRQEIVDGVLLGLGEAIATPYKPGTYWVNKNIKVRPFDAGKARALLAEAGWTDSNADGVMDKDGKPLSFTILTNNGNKQRADTATIIQQRLKDVGIQVKVRLVEWSAFIENFINKRDFDAVILGWSLSPSRTSSASGIPRRPARGSSISSATTTRRWMQHWSPPPESSTAQNARRSTTRCSDRSTKMCRWCSCMPPTRFPSSTSASMASRLPPPVSAGTASTGMCPPPNRNTRSTPSLPDSGAI